MSGRVSRRLRVALALGPNAVARLLLSLLSTRDRDPWDGATSTWIADYYAAELTEAARSTMRDAIVRAIGRAPAEQDEPLVLVRLLNLATAVQVIQASSRNVEDRLWSAANHHLEAKDAVSAARIVGMLASEGRTRSPEFWAGRIDSLGPVASVACTLGVFRASGVRVALDWIRVRVPADYQDDTLTALMPLMAEASGDQITGYLRESEDPVFAARLMNAAEDLGVALLLPAPLDERGFPVVFARELLTAVEDAAAGVRVFMTARKTSVATPAFLDANAALEQFSHEQVVAALLDGVEG